ncbi:uncharacterized protein [Primulina huaijiensis]|uniref:uncharacterized protein n=1 Tax=Primulina huaijiensis TaxID=1492673 RepID=UPI003CC742B0
MTHSEVSSRMVKWTIEFGEYDIEYKPRVAIKAQALSDFHSDMIQLDKEEVWRVFVDRAYSLSGCGIGVVVISLPGEKIKLALRIDSRVTNNEAKDEAILAGMRAIREAEASCIILYSDLQLVTQQIKGAYEAKDEKMLKYLKLILAQTESFMDWSIEQIPREENNEADALAKMASSLAVVSNREILFFTRLIISTKKELLPMQKTSWTLIEFMAQGHLPDDRARAQKVRNQAFRFWWPTLNQDSSQMVRTCEGCQRQSNFPHSPAPPMRPIWASFPFDQWGMEIIGPIPMARARITEKEVLKFLWKNIVCQFRVPRRLISDNGRQFHGKEITSWCQEMKITQSFTSVAYPQANGQTEVVNKIIVQALKTRLQGKGKDWVKELPSVFSAYKTTPRALTQETSFNLMYGSELVLRVEIGQSSARVEYYPDKNNQKQAMELDMVEEKRKRATIRMEAYRGRVMNSYNKRVPVRNFPIIDMVMKKVNPAGGVGKLEARWERPFKII